MLTKSFLCTSVIVFSSVAVVQGMRDDSDALKDKINPRHLLMGETYGRDMQFVASVLSSSAHPDVRDGQGETALIKAARWNAIKAMTLLLAVKANVEARDQQGRTALVEATFQNCVDSIEVLIAAKANVCVEDIYGESVLLNAIRVGTINVIKLILAARADVNAPNFYQELPLHKAIVFGRVDVLKLLIETQADIDATSSSGKTALDFALYRPARREVIRALISRLLQTQWLRGPVELCDMIVDYCDDDDAKE